MTSAVSTSVRRAFLFAAALCFTASVPEAQVSCRATPPDPLPEPVPNETVRMFSEADIVLERWNPDSLRLVRADRTEYRLESSTAGVRSRVRWNSDRQEWNETPIETTPFVYTYPEGLDEPRQTEILFIRSDGTPGQRDTTTYDAEGRMLVDLRQDWDAERGVWVDNRWNEFHAYEGDEVAAYTFYRVIDGTPYIDTRLSTEFDERGNRTVCSYENGTNAPNSLRRTTRYRTTYNERDQKTTVIRELMSEETGQWAVADSSSFTFDDEGRPTGFGTYDLKDGTFVLDQRVTLEYDADGNHYATQRDEYVSRRDGIRPRNRAEYTYAPDGRIATKTEASWDPEAASWHPPRYRRTYVWQNAVDTEPLPASPTLSLQTFPNPAATTLQVSFEGLPPGTYRLGVVDVLGRRAVADEAFHHTGETGPRSVDVSGLATGTYFVRVSSESRSATSAFTVAR